MSTVKRATKTCNLFCNIAAQRVEKQCSAFYFTRSNLSCNKQGCCCKLTPDWIKLRGNDAIHWIYVTCCKIRLPWAGKPRNMITNYRFSCKKYHFSLLSATTFRKLYNLICWKTVWFGGDAEHHSSTQFATSCPFLMSVLSYLYLLVSIFIITGRELLCSLVMIERAVEARLYFVF